MHRFRTHIIQYLLTILLICGMGFQLSSAANQDLREAVLQQWLQWQLNSYGDDIKAELAGLGYDDEEILSVIRDAYLPVNKEDKSSTDDSDVFHILIQQWNEFNDQHQGMGKAVVLEQQKPSAIQHNDGFLSSGKTPDHAQLKAGSSEIKSSAFSELPSAYTLIPMKGGTAIGAP